MLFINAKVLPICSEEIPNGYVLVRDGKILSVGDMADLPGAPGEEVLDLGGRLLLPGLIDAHSHMGLSEEGVGSEGDDINEMSDPCTPHVRAIDGINPIDRSFAETLAGGVTCVVASPGSANPIGGQIVAFKPVGRRIDSAVVKEPLAMKMALGENPKRIYGSRKEAPTCRMAEASIIREALTRARRYGEAKRRAAEGGEKEPELDFKSEALLPVLERRMRVHFHAHRASDILTAVRIAREFDLDYVLVHCTEGHLIPDLLAAEGARVICGPIITTRSKPELSNLEVGGAVALIAEGIEAAIATDHPVIPAHYLATSAALVAAEGLDSDTALKTITLWAARAVGLEDRLGSIEPGKDADLLVYGSHPLHTFQKPEMVFVNGERLI